MNATACRGAIGGPSWPPTWRNLAPERVAGLHLNFLSIPRPRDDTVDLTEEESTSQAAMSRWQATEAGYSAIQGTKPQTVGYALDDSPIGLCAWIVEKFRSWSDCGGDVERSFTKDQLLTNISLYWFTRTATSSARIYREMRDAGAGAVPRAPISVPTGVAMYPAEVARTPRRWAERRYNITWWNEMPRGGHFAAMEVPDICSRPTSGGSSRPSADRWAERLLAVAVHAPRHALGAERPHRTSTTREVGDVTAISSLAISERLIVPPGNTLGWLLEAVTTAVPAAVTDCRPKLAAPPSTMAPSSSESHGPCTLGAHHV